MTDFRDELARTTLGAAKVELPPSQFDSVDAERTYVKQRLAGAFRVFGYLGYDEGVAGHISVRDPARADHFWVNPVAVHFSLIKASDLVLVNHAGEIVEGDQLVNSAAFAIHSRLHAARPDINAVAHAHSPYGRAFSAMGKLLEPISQDACMFYENHALFNEFNGVVDATDEGDAIARALGTMPAAILKNHGLLTTGSSVDIACGLFMAMESACRSQLLADAAGTPARISHDIAIKTRDYNATDLVKWANFQPTYQLVLRQDDSFLC